MKTVSEQKLRRIALAKGGTLELDGSPFNAGMAVARVERTKPATAPAAEPSLSMSDVERMLAARDALWRDTLQRELARVEAANRANQWKFNMSYNNDGRIDEIDATRVS